MYCNLTEKLETHNSFQIEIMVKLFWRWVDKMGKIEGGDSFEEALAGVSNMWPAGRMWPA